LRACRGAAETQSKAANNDQSCAVKHHL
jgi:hypothetical protein